MAANTTKSQRKRAAGTAQSTGSATTESTTPRSDAAKIREGLTKARNGVTSYARRNTERAVDLPVGAALTSAERINEMVEPWTRQSSRERELRGLRQQVRRELGKFERRGGTARRRATRTARQTRTRVERVLKRRRRSIETTVKRNRAKAEKTVKENRARAEDGLKRAQSTVEERVSTLV
jgi:hypothetical protein